MASIRTNANSCCRLAVERHRLSGEHGQSKAHTHLTESSVASIRNNLARSKRYSKSWQMLEASPMLFLNRRLIKTTPS